MQTVANRSTRTESASAGSTAFVTSLLLVSLLAGAILIPTAAAAPAISNVTPNSGPTNGGTTVTITGTGFVDGALVEINGKAAEQIKVTGTTSITAVTSPHAAGGPFNLKVTNPDGTATNWANAFTYSATANPSITSIAPGSGSSRGGTEVTINGANFAAGATVTVGTGAGCAGAPQKWIVSSVTSTEIKAVTIGRAAAAGLNVCVANVGPGGTTATLNTAYSFTASASPTVTTVSPSSGTANGGTTVLLTGTGFAPGSTVSFGGTASVEVIYSSSTQISATAPKGTGTVAVLVTNPDTTTSAGTPVSYLYTALTASDKPTIATVVPAVGSIVGGTEVTITGTKFHMGANEKPAVEIGGNVVPAADVKVVSSTSIVAKAPAHAAGLVDVKITNPEGSVANSQVTATNKFNYLAHTRLLSASPTTGTSAGNQLVTLTGEGLPTVEKVMFGNREATICTAAATPHASCTVAPSATSIEVISPPNSAGASTITYQGTGGKLYSMAGAFSYTSAPAPTMAAAAVSPTNGPTNGGTLATITGTNYQVAFSTHMPTVTIGGVAASLCTALNTPTTGCAAPSSTALMVIAPGRSTDTAAPNQIVKVTNPDGATVQSDAADNSDDFDYVASANPTLAALNAVDPLNGPTTGGTPVLIQGTNFHNGANAKPTVKIGATTIPADSVKVLAAGTAASPATFGKACPAGPAQPCIVAMSPAKTGGAALVNQKVTVTNPNGESVTSDATDNTDDFDYAITAAPSITSLNVNAGSQTGGTFVRITGTNFGEITRDADGVVCAAAADTYVKTTAITTLPVVKFGGTVASAVCVASATEIHVVTPPHAGGAVDVEVTNADGQKVTQVGGFTYGALGAAPTLTTVAPATSLVAGGITVTLTGTGFGPVTQDSSGDGCAAGTFLEKGEYLTTPVPTVSVGGVAATAVCVVSGTSLTFKAPAHAVGKVTITATMPDGQSVGIGNSFEYLPAGITVASMSKATGKLTGGDAVTFTGTGFDPAKPPEVLLQQGATSRVAPIGSVTTTTVASTILPQTFGGSSTPEFFIVAQDGQTATLRGAYTYQSALPPTFTSISPASGSVNGGSTITVTGHGFGPEATVTVDGVAATGVTVASATSISFVTPNLAATTGKVLGPVTVEIENAPGHAAQKLTLAQKYAYTGTVGPVVSSISPNSGPTTGGTTVTISGANFVSGATVKIGGVAATDIAFVNANTLTAKTASHAAGAVAVEVTSGGQVATLSNGFTYIAAPAPTVSSVSPSSGDSNGGTTVTITGTNFVTGATVKFGTTAATVTSVSSTSIVATSPAHPVGAVNVVVTNPDAQTATQASGFTYTAAPAPTLSSLSPATGTSNGGTEITLTGTNFVAGAKVSFGGTQAATGDVTVVSATSITAKTPAHAAGVVPVVVTNPDGKTATLASSFTYVAAAAPTTTAISPATGPAAGTNSVTVTGTNFVAGVKVSFGANEGTVTSQTATSIVVTVPAGAGSVDVTVTNPDGQTAKLTAAYTYDASATVTPGDIRAANLALQGNFNVHRHGDDNEIHFDISGITPDVKGVQIWKSLSPFTLLVSLDESSPDFKAGSYVDKGAPAKATYIVTAFYSDSVTGGKVASLNDALGYNGLTDEQIDAKAERAEDDSGQPWWFWVLIAAGILVVLLIIIGIIVAARRGGPGEPEDGSWDEPWDEPVDGSWDDANDAGWDEPVEEHHAAPAHELQCPKCDHEFMAHGDKPLKTTCPNCGVKGILN